MSNKNILRCNICDNNLEKIFNYDSEHSYYRCRYCNYVKRIPSDMYIDYSNEYMSEELLRKSHVLAKYYYRRLNKILKNESVCLEIGGSFGFFCKMLKEKKNCTVYNVESSLLASDYANKNKITTVSKIEEIDSNLSFDYIFSFHVLEHILPDDINNLISNLTAKLKSGGLLIIFTPNADSFKINLFKKGYPWLAFPEHISFLSKKAIEIIFEKNNIEKISISSEIPSYFHYPVISLISKIRKIISPKKLSEISQTGFSGNRKTIITNSLSLAKTFFHTFQFIERLCLLPFYYLSELFSSDRDELVIIGRKKSGY